MGSILSEGDYLKGKDAGFHFFVSPGIVTSLVKDKVINYIPGGETISEFMYLLDNGYKNIKYITSIKFLDTRKRNYWSNSGPYSVDGTIQPGIDHPLDFKKKPLPINGGEVFHFFDKRPPV